MEHGVAKVKLDVFRLCYMELFSIKTFHAKNLKN